MLRKTLLATALATASLATAHAGGFDLCDIDSDYRVQLSPQSLAFERDDGTPRRVEMSRGWLTVDGRAVELNAADRERITEFEATVREIVPEAKAIALDAVDVAFDAVGAVAQIFETDAARLERTAEKLAESRLTIERELERSFERQEWNDARFEHVIEQSIATLVPTLVGDITATALSIAFSGDEHAARELEQRAERLEERIEREVEARAKALERRADALCPIVADLDRIEAQLTFRLAGDRRLDLIQRD
jgi:hypothetical protein